MSNRTGFVAFRAGKQRQQAIDYARRSARFALMRGETSMALRTARQLVRAEPATAEHGALLAEALAATDEARRVIVAPADGSPAAVHARAAAHLALGDLMAAANLWLSLARADPGLVDAFINFAWCMARLGNADVAGDIAARVAESLRHPKVHAVEMMAALAKGDEKRAIKAARTALALDRQAAVWLPMGRAIEIKRAANEEALSLGALMEPASATLHLIGVIAALGEQRHGEALAELNAILAEIPDDEWAGVFKVRALFGLKDLAGAAQAQAEVAARAGGNLDKLAMFVYVLDEMDADAEILDFCNILKDRLKDRHDLAFIAAWAAMKRADFAFADDIRALLPEPAFIRKAGLSPFTTLALFDDPALQKEVGTAFARSLPPALPVPQPLKAARGGPIRIGYFSNDFHDHATMHLIGDVIAHADRSRFEIVAYSYDLKPDNPYRRRFAEAIDRFVDVSRMGDTEIAEAVRRDGVHILVDLKGYTAGSRSNVLRHRLAPVQANWLGYPGTTGLAEMDYIVADGFIVPPGAEQHYSEQVVRLPDCYQPNTARAVAEAPGREAAGLPAEGFVYASLNQTYKLTSAMLADWMAILAAVPGSVLWLMSANEEIDGRLRAFAAGQGIAPERIALARPAPNARHLARYHHVDLALDTYPCGSHTTASDALWVGAPLLARAGRSFAARVSGSIVRAAGLPELIAATDEDYKATAIALGKDPARARALRERLTAGRDTAPLFDARRFAAHLDAAYAAMVETWRSGRKPRGFDVAPVDGRRLEPAA